MSERHLALLAEAFEAYECASRFDPSDRRIALGHAKVRREWGAALLAAGQVDAALDELRATVARFEELIEAYPGVRDFESGRLLTLETLVPHATSCEETLALSLGIADGKLALAHSMDRPGLYHLAAAAGELNAATWLVELRGDEPDALTRAEKRLASARALLAKVGPSLRPRASAEMTTLVELLHARVHASRGAASDALAGLRRAQETDGATNGYVAVQRALAWRHAAKALEGAPAPTRADSFFA